MTDSAVEKKAGENEIGKFSTARSNAPRSAPWAC